MRKLLINSIATLTTVVALSTNLIRPQSASAIYVGDSLSTCHHADRNFNPIGKSFECGLFIVGSPFQRNAAPDLVVIEHGTAATGYQKIGIAISNSSSIVSDARIRDRRVFRSRTNTRPSSYFQFNNGRVCIRDNSTLRSFCYQNPPNREMR